MHGETTSLEGHLAPNTKQMLITKIISFILLMFKILKTDQIKINVTKNLSVEFIMQFYQSP